jgi:hypothetical protein
MLVPNDFDVHIDCSNELNSIDSIRYYALPRVAEEKAVHANGKFGSII